MKNLSRSILRFLPLTGLLAGMILFAGAVQAQRDHLTDAETDLIRYYRELDKRTEVFIKAADRRFAIINGTAQPSTKKASEEEPPPRAAITPPLEPHCLNASALTVFPIPLAIPIPIRMPANRITQRSPWR